MTTSKTVYSQYAGFVTRFIAFFIDIAIITIISAVVAAVTRMILEFFRAGELATTIAGIVMAGFHLSFAFLYFVFLWMAIGQTPGKMLLGLRVVRANGGPITFGVALRRWIGYFISAILFLGFLWVFMDARRQGWHDKIANTFVVYTWAAKKPPPDLGTLRERLRQRRKASQKQV